VIRGCVPKKLLVYGAGFREEFKDAEGFGWSHGGKMPEFNWERLLAAKTGEIERLNGIYKGLLGGAGVTTFEGAVRPAAYCEPHVMQRHCESSCVESNGIL